MRVRLLLFGACVIIAWVMTQVCGYYAGEVGNPFGEFFAFLVVLTVYSP